MLLLQLPTLKCKPVVEVNINVVDRNKSAMKVLSSVKSETKKESQTQKVMQKVLREQLMTKI